MTTETTTHDHTPPRGVSQVAWNWVRDRAEERLRVLDTMRLDATEYLDRATEECDASAQRLADDLRLRDEARLELMMRLRTEKLGW